jgi:hypothetical protein
MARIPDTLHAAQVMYRLKQLDDRLYRPDPLGSEGALTGGGTEAVGDAMRLEIRKLAISIALGRPYQKRRKAPAFRRGDIRRAA